MKKILSVFALAFVMAFSAFPNIAYADPAYDIPKTLRYLSRTYTGISRDYNYTAPPGGFVNGDETEYNAITWNEDPVEFPKPDWVLIYSNAVRADWYYNEYLSTVDNFPAVKSKVDGLPTGASLTSSLNAKADKTITVNGQALSSNVSITTITGNAGTATALANNGSNCSSGEYSRGVDASGNAESCTALPSIPSELVVGTPNSRTMSAATAYQCTDNTKPCTFTITVSCPTLSVLGTTTCTGEVRIGSANTVASGASGTVIAPIQRQVGGILGLASSDYETKTVHVPTGWYIAVRNTATSSGAAAFAIPAAFDQSLSIQ